MDQRGSVRTYLTWSTGLETVGSVILNEGASVLEEEGGRGGGGISSSPDPPPGRRPAGART